MILNNKGKIKKKNECYDFPPILLVLHFTPVHPGLQREHSPLCMWHVLSLQLAGQGMSQVLPYTLALLQPVLYRKVAQDWNVKNSIITISVKYTEGVLPMQVIRDPILFFFSIYQITLKITTFKYLCFLILHKLIAAEFLLNKRIIS